MVISAEHHAVKVRMIFLFHLLVFCSSDAETIDFTTEIKPLEYRNIIGRGFATSYFKSLHYKYNDINIQDIAAQGFNNVRLRCRADLDNLNMNKFLNDLEHVVDTCLANKIVPIISWIHHKAEAFPTEVLRLQYVNWWTQVAEKLKTKDYRLSFNLFTELGVDSCGNDCSGSLARDIDKYNNWTKSVVKAIRNTGRKNGRRILLLASPTKDAKGLHSIDESIYRDDKFMMVEWHIYASGPNKKIFHNADGSIRSYGQKYWNGNGDGIGKRNVDKAIKYATDFTQTSGMLTYLGAWMPVTEDNTKGELNEAEVISFARYFIKALEKVHVPWSLNALERYYDTKRCKWKAMDRAPHLNMSSVLQAIKMN